MKPGERVVGRRVYPNAEGHVLFAEGDYGLDHGIWYGRPPGFHAGSFEGHDVVEHEDGTITISPSILYTETRGDETLSWHGYLERGVWRAC